MGFYYYYGNRADRVDISLHAQRRTDINNNKNKVKSSHIYLYSAFHNTDCIKAASQ